MDKDKITAIWEEDGDLMRIKQFFNYLNKEEEDLKERIRQKTLAKINENPDSPAAGKEGQEEDIIFKQTIADSNAQAYTSDLTKQSSVNEEDQASKVKSLIKTLKKPRKKYISLAAAAVFLVFLTFTGSLILNNLGGLYFGSDKLEQMATDDAGSAGSGELNGSNGIAPEENRMNVFSASKTAPAASMENRDQAMESIIDPKIIYVMDATIKVNNIDSAVNELEEWVKKTGGYIAESERNNSDDYNRAHLVIKIPASSFESFRNDLSDLGNVINQHLSTEDITQEYFDVETRLRNWQAQEKRYLEILEEAENVEDILKIENSLAEVRRQIDHLKGQLKYWDNRINYSELRINLIPISSNIQISEPWEPVSFPATLIAAKNAVIKSVSYIWNGINYLLILVAYLIPAVLILISLYFVIKRLRIRNKQKNKNG